MYGGRDRHTANYTRDTIFIKTEVGARGGRRIIRDYIKYQQVIEIDKLRGRIGYTLTLLDDGNVMLFGGKQRSDVGRSSSTDMFRDTTPEGIFIFTRENSSWTEATVEGDVPEGRAFHTATKVGGKIVLIGGVNIEGDHVQHVPSYILTYNTQAKSFHSHKLDSPSSSIHISHHSCNALHNNSLILSGGYNADNTMNSKTYLINISDDVSIRILQTGFENVGHHTCAIGDKTYAFGGQNKKRIWVFSCESVPERMEEGTEMDTTEVSELSESEGECERDVESEQSESSDDAREAAEHRVQIRNYFVCNLVTEDKCINNEATGNVKDVILECAECGEYYHLFCIGFSTSPFRNDEQKEESIYYCERCRNDDSGDIRNKLRFSRRQWQTLNNNKGILKDHHF